MTLPTASAKRLGLARFQTAVSSRYVRGLTIACAGALLGVAGEHLVTGTLRLLSALAALMALATLALFLAAQDHAKQWSELRDAHAQDTTSITRGIDLLARTTALELSDLKSQFGLQIQLQRIEDLADAETIEQDIVSEAMASAQTEVLVADMAFAYGVADNAIPSRLRQLHYERLIQRAADISLSLSYHRICQLVDSKQWPQGLVDPVMRDHCRAMCSLNQQAGARVVLAAAPRVFPYTWILIDDELLILELYRHDDSGAPRFYRAMLIRDPQRGLIRVFRAMWDDLEHHPDTRTVRLAEV